MTEMQAAGRPHSRENPPGTVVSGHRRDQATLRALSGLSGENSLSEMDVILPDTCAFLNAYPHLIRAFASLIEHCCLIARLR